MRLTRYKNKGFVFETKICSIGKLFGKGYFIAFIYPFVDFGRDVYKSDKKPKFRNIYAIGALFFLPWILMAIAGGLYAVLYVIFLAIGGDFIINIIKDAKHSGSFTQVLSAFCLTSFYLIGIVYIIHLLIW